MVAAIDSNETSILFRLHSLRTCLLLYENTNHRRTEALWSTSLSSRYGNRGTAADSMWTSAGNILTLEPLAVASFVLPAVDLGLFPSVTRELPCHMLPLLTRFSHRFASDLLALDGVLA